MLSRRRCWCDCYDLADLMLLPLTLIWSSDRGGLPFSMSLTDFMWVFMATSTPGASPPISQHEDLLRRVPLQSDTQVLALWSTATQTGQTLNRPQQHALATPGSSGSNDS